MNFILSDHIISPIAVGTDANLKAVIEGHTALQLYRHYFPSVDPFFASIMEDEGLKMTGLSRFESLCVSAIRGAVRPEMDSLLSSSDTLFILSSTKGNIEYLAKEKNPSLIISARKVAQWFGNHNEPIVVCNACISGVCALITAQRMLELGKYRNAVVVGCDVLSTFIVSGFQSFKALSEEQCKPFDANRKGLNLGEAAACMILSSDTKWANVSLGTIIAGAIHNDANHISGPSRTGEGSYLCLRDVMRDGDKEKISFINLHGTATFYNDEMESIAVNRAGLQEVPVNSLKSIFGHTLGAAGVLETILSLHALHAGVVIPTHNYSSLGTTHPLNVTSDCRKTTKNEFIKLMSGFGGCNAAIRISIAPNALPISLTPVENIRTDAEVYISPERVVRNGTSMIVKEKGEKLLYELYRTYVKDYPKFYKMDTLSRLGFIATELLFDNHQVANNPKQTAIVFANRSASLKNDMDYQYTIQCEDNYYPSPALFVYTLPNIVTGEVAIRNLFQGESSLYIAQDETALKPLAELAFLQPDVITVVYGWVECSDKDCFEAHVKLLHKY